MSFNPCGDCNNCLEQLPGYCTTGLARNWTGTRPDGSLTLTSIDGKSIYGNFFGQSSFSQLALVHRNCIIKVAPDTDLKLFAPLGCGIQTGAGVVNNTCNVRKGDSLVVSGCGAVGLSAIIAAKARAAAVIIAVDIKTSRLSLAKELGATHVLNGGESNLVERIHAICPLPVGVKFAFDTSGVPSVIEAMIAATGIRGKTVVVGATSPDKKISIQPLQYLEMGKHFVGSIEGESFPPEVSRSQLSPTSSWASDGLIVELQSIPYLLAEARQGRLPLEKMVKQYHYKDFASALEDMHSGTVIKPILVWKDV